MPTYQYACTHCGHTFERFQSFHDDALTHCPECDGRLRKVFNAVGIVFKGGGFYKTDSRGKSSSTTTSSSANGDSGPSTSTDGSASSKPASETSSASKSSDTASSAKSSDTSSSSTP